ncbi:hypothetical protein [Hymenobacter rubripertinctus]|uniref:Uncharacterized protein n=1 Tax=Hymenobacter rubripertinctus TaxID=2029981 RepID=A0A418R643_9BACT|nr:hypothetical protein [Hymenobacter rubripertinctus]RIY12866.1 hypothetical protein D0T11_03840 [Hymenobacter rubripertinctus]
MRTLRTRLAFVLLLCFARVLLPDTWVLALHAHAHTNAHTVEGAVPTAGTARSKAQLSARHQHCTVDHFYDAAFQPSAPLHLSVRLALPEAALSWAAQSVWHSATRATADLRGPPRVA